jgi:RHS repeat-associated protein
MGQTRYLVDPLAGWGQVVEERDAGNSLLARYELDGGILRMDRGGASSWVLDDPAGSTAGLAGGTGSLTDRYAYDVFGMPVRVSGATDTPFLGIGGEQYDAATGLYYLRARYYDPQAGRFLSTDPVDGFAGDPASQHDYSYAANDPANYSDPSGLFSLTETSMSADIGLKARLAMGVFDGVKDYVIDTTIESLLSGENKFSLEGLVTGAATGALNRVAPGVGKIVGLVMNFASTAQSLQASFGVLMDPNASSEEKYMAGMDALFGMATFSLDVKQANHTSGQSMRSKGGSRKRADALDEGGIVSPKGPGITESREFRSSSLTTQNGSKITHERFAEGCGLFSFLPDTLVAAGDTKDGQSSEGLPDASEAETTRPISELKVGDPVVARNADTGVTEWKRVTAIHSRTAYEVVYLHLADSTGKIVETLGTTAEHPFMTPAGWVDAGQLGIGAQIVTRAGPSLVIAKVERVTKSEGVTVYNLTVDGDHTYFAGSASGGVLSHNTKTCDVKVPLSTTYYPNPDPPMSEPPVRYTPQSREEVERMRQGDTPKGRRFGDDSIEPHHRQQIPTEAGGIIDEITRRVHRSGGNHTRITCHRI